MLTALKAGFAYFGVVFGAGFALGVLRTLVVIPRVGELTAVLLELPVILSLSWIASRWLVATFAVDGLSARLMMGAVAFALTMAGEIGVSVLALGRTVGEHFASFQSGLALLGLAAQIVFGLIPAVQLSARVKRD
ncbi:MAG: hypothetical protein ABL901_17925 [Hyphomicrobiaceae bacterium]